MLLFMKMIGTTSLEDIPDNLPNSTTGKMSWLRRMSKEIVDSVFKPTDPDDLHTVIDAMSTEGGKYVYPFCQCRKGEQCSIPLNCLHNQCMHVD